MNTHSTKAVKEFCHVVAHDALGRPGRVAVPGHEGRKYEVIFYRNRMVLETRCLQDMGTLGMVECPSNGYQCYHVLAACEVCAAEKHQGIAWCNSRDNARQLARLGGRMFTVADRRSGRRAWGVIRDEGSK